MSRKESRRNSRTRSDVAFNVMSSLPALIVKGGLAYLKFKSVRRKGVKTFRKQLNDSGMTKEQIAELTKQYEDIGRIRSYLGDFSFLGGFG